MILRRLGNKQKLAEKIQEYFPPHKIYALYFILQSDDLNQRLSLHKLVMVNG